MLGAAACDDDGDGGPACTEMFAVVTIKVVDPAGAPLEDATVTTAIVRTGDLITPTTLMLLEPGTYAVVDDGNLGQLRRTGEQLRFIARSGAVEGRADLTVVAQDGCHVLKTAGPDSVVAQYMED